MHVPLPSPAGPGGHRRRLAGLLVAVLAATALPLIGGSAPAVATPADRGPWQAVSGDVSTTARSGRAPDIRAERFAAYTLDRASLADTLDDAPAERAGTARRGQPALTVALPTPTGEFQRFALLDSPVMEPGLAARHPEIKTYVGRGLDDPTATVRADLTPLGFHASVRSSAGSWYIDPYYHADQSVYASYYGQDLVDGDPAFVEREDVAAAAEALQPEVTGAVPAGPLVSLRTYRLALVTDPSYATFFGAGNVTAAKVTLINRVTQIYEDETAIRLVLVNDTDKTNLNTAALATEPNGPCGASACYTTAQISSCTGSLLNRNRIVLGQLIGAGNYDVGHIGLGLPGGGVAGLGVVGGDGKARGCTGLPTPVGDFYAVDYVSHEIGHQFAGNHTFNGTQYNCSGGNRSATNSYEPGSGSSIMAYAGICQQDNLQPHSDPYWSQRSYTEITTFITGTRPAINEVQTLSLYGFDTDGESFTVSYAGQSSAPIVRGGNYTTAGIKAAIEAIAGWPAGATATVAAFGGSGTLNDTGFQVTFGGALAATNVGSLGLTGGDGVTGFVGETAKGGTVDNGGVLVEQTSNRAPVVTLPTSSYTIPARTPFTLTGGATDADGDTVTYLWEQNDRGGSAGTALVNNTKTNGPLFRQFGVAAAVSPTDTLEYHSPGENAVSTDPTRHFPDLGQIAANNTNAATGVCPAAPAPPATGGASNVPAATVDCFSEFLPTADWVGIDNDRTMHFRLTARDSHPGGGGIGSADVSLTVAPTAGPFLVTSQAAPTAHLGGGTAPVTWDVAGTNTAPINVTDVRISLSVDGGATFPYVLAERTPNTGAATVTLPNVDTARGRIRIEALGNVFFDLNDADLTITQVRAATVAYTGDALAYPVAGAGSTGVLLRATVLGAGGDVRNATVTFKEGDEVLCSAPAKPFGGAATDGSASCSAVLPVGAHSITAVLGGAYTGSGTAGVTVAGWDGRSIAGSGYLKGGNTAGGYPLDDDRRIELTLDARINNGKKLVGTAKVGYKSDGKRYKFQSTGLDSIGIGEVAGVPVADLRYPVTLYDISTAQSPVAVATGLTMRVTVTDRGEPGRRDGVGITVWDGDRLVFSSDWTGSTTQEITLTASGGNLTIG
ncbi:M12 family metallo-peptidase [Micromonospora sp. NPDC092111]|uniref:M12 family metallo-peptidase n=1 Tax=Micromonospora sp. NPDC092111 TaxID=3364289 RepID=UPI0037F5B368